MIMIMKVFLSLMMISRMMTLITTIIIFRYEFASPEVLAGTTETLRKETLCMFTPDEVKLFN